MLHPRNTLFPVLIWPSMPFSFFSHPLPSVKQSRSSEGAQTESFRWGINEGKKFPGARLSFFLRKRAVLGKKLYQGECLLLSLPPQSVPSPSFVLGRSSGERAALGGLTRPQGSWDRGAAEGLKDWSHGVSLAGCRVKLAGEAESPGPVSRCCWRPASLGSVLLSD